MKTSWKIIWLIPFLCAVAASPLGAQVNTADDPAIPAPAAPPTAPTAPATPEAPVPGTNAAVHAKKHKPQEAVPEVHIGPDGIHIGGPNPASVNVPGHGFGGPNFLEVVLVMFAILVPFATLAGIFGLFLYFRYRRNKMLHDTLRAMIEKGVPIPPELLAPPSVQPFATQRMSRKRNDLRTGLVWTAIGLGVTFCFIASQSHAWPLGFIFVLVGVAFLITWKLDQKDASNSEAGPK